MNSLKPRRARALVILLPVVAILFGCGTPDDPPEKTYSVVPVWYATDRKPTGDTKAPAYFSGKRGELSYGKVLVAIPKSHCVGCLEEPSLMRLELRFDPRKHVTLLDEITPLKSRAFWKSLRNTLRQSRQKEITVFIHGYKVTFEDAARRTGQLFFDLGRPGAAVLYSWPSTGSYSLYLEDSQNAEVTIPNLKTFLAGVSRYTGAERVSIIAHSKGNEPLVKALHEMVQVSARARFREIVLTAPDIDTTVFRRLAKKIKRMGRRVTLYTSRRDQALLASKEIAGGYPRAGDSADGVTVIDGIETVDASNVETDLFGHSYYSRSTRVLADIRAVLRGRTPSRRQWLREKRAAGKRYWEIKPAGLPAP